MADEMRGGPGREAEEHPSSGRSSEEQSSEGGPDEEALRAQLEEEIKRVRVEDVVLQSVVSILNLAARRIAKDDERDLDQAKVGIDAARALVDLVREDARPQLRQAISELQLLYAKHAGEESAESQQETEPEQGESEPPKGDSGLWTPPGS